MSSRTLILSTAVFFLIGGGIFVAHLMRSDISNGDSISKDPISYAEIATASPALPNAHSASSTEIQIPILVYHVVRPSYPSDSAAVRALALTPETFDAEMLYLKNAGYHIVQFSDLESYFAHHTTLPSKPVILSFDDGWHDQFVYAFPILQKYGYTATFFIFTNAVGHTGFLTWDNLHTLIAAGMTIGAHTRSHTYFTHILSTTTLWSEIDGSRKLLQKELGTPINEFAYPFGQYNSNIVSLVQAAGFKAARGDYYTGEQSKSRLYGLSAINAPTTLPRFEQLLSKKLYPHPSAREGTSFYTKGRS